MSRSWGQNIIIDGSTIRERYQDVIPYGTDPPQWYTSDNHNSNENAASYESTTQEVVRKITTITVGNVLVTRFNISSQTVTIRPLNDAAIGLTGTTPADDHASRPGGTGSGATIWYNPSTWTNSSEKRSADPSNHFQPDDVLFHEMVHALRMIRGLSQPDNRIARWDSVEDLYAIMLTNIYLSNSNRNADLRGDHRIPFQTLPDSLLNPGTRLTDMTFYTQNGPDIDRICHAMTDLCDPISRIPQAQCNWNPLRARLEAAEWDRRLYGIGG